MTAERPPKIALVGARGYDRKAPQRIDCFQWDKLNRDLNLRDYDTVVLNLLSPDALTETDWDAFQHVLDYGVASELLQSEGRIIVLGDPRFSIPDDDGKHRPFLIWTGITFFWDERSGDTVVLNNDYGTRNYWAYLSTLRHWNYSLTGCEPSQAIFGKLVDQAEIERTGFRVVVDEKRLCYNRYGNNLAFVVRVQLEKRTRQAYGIMDTRIMSRSGPIIFLPKTDLDEDQAIITILRDLCGVESELPEPVWISEMVAPGQKAVDDEIRQINTKIESLREDLALCEKRREDTRSCLKLLFERGLPLEKAVRDVLRSLGAYVEDSSEVGKEDGWITLQIGAQTFEGVLEIKSTKNDQFGEEGLRQLLDWVNRGIQTRQKRYKGIFIGNSAVEKPIKERAWAFSDNWKKSAEVGQLVALTTVDLYVIYLLNTGRKLDRDRFWKEVFDRNGIFDIAPYVEVLVPQNRELEG